MASTLSKYNLKKGDLFVLSWARVRQVTWGSISSELLMCGGGVRSILLLPLVARCSFQHAREEFIHYFPHIQAILSHNFEDQIIEKCKIILISNTNCICQILFQLIRSLILWVPKTTAYKGWNCWVKPFPRRFSISESVCSGQTDSLLNDAAPTLGLLTT